jgi:hypothetical protein
VAVAETAEAHGAVVGEDLLTRARSLVAAGVVTADEVEQIAAAVALCVGAA